MYVLYHPHESFMKDNTPSHTLKVWVCNNFTRLSGESKELFYSFNIWKVCHSWAYVKMKFLPIYSFLSPNQVDNMVLNVQTGVLCGNGLKFVTSLKKLQSLVHEWREYEDHLWGIATRITNAASSRGEWVHPHVCFYPLIAVKSMHMSFVIRSCWKK